MAWQRVKATIAGTLVEALLWTGGARLAMPWREGIALGQAVEIRGARYTVTEILDPGGRRDRLELGLTPAAAARERRSSFETPAAGAPQDERAGTRPRAPRRPRDKEG